MTYLQNSFIEADYRDIDLTEYVIANQFLLKENKSIFDGTKFEYLSTRSTKAKGAFGEKIIEKLSRDLGFYVEAAKDKRSGDRVINGLDVEIKSVLQSITNKFVISQIRPAYSYQYVVTLLIMPNKVEILTVPKNEMIAKCKGQHGGNEAHETMMYSKDYDEILYDFGHFMGVEHFYKTFKKEG